MSTQLLDGLNTDVIKIDYARNDKLTEFGKATMRNSYLLHGEDYQDCFARVAYAYSDNIAHAQRLYDYISNLWFMPATPILSNGGSSRGFPISCFLNETNDSMESIVGLWNENTWLASHGGGIGSFWGNVRSIGERIAKSGDSSGIIPFLKVMDSMTLAISQGSLRRGSAACYLPIDHPEIEEFIEIRRPTGGDYNRKTLNMHHGVVITDAFMRAVENDEEWGLKSPKDKSVLRIISARDLWIRLLSTRMDLGEPYILFIDTVNKAIPEHHKLAGLMVKTSNLCAEIVLPTGIDLDNKRRTAVCCLSSLNVERFREWRDNPLIIDDVMRFLDNVLQDFIDRAPPSMEHAIYAATQERSVGLGVMGWHAFLQSENIPMESALAKVWNNKIFSHIKIAADLASKTLATEKAPCPDAARYGFNERFSNKIAIAPNASISIICGGTSPGIEPIAANSFTHKTLAGSFTVRNQALETVLAKYNKNTQDIWRHISIHEGSVNQLDFLTENEKNVFKTAFEIDQKWLVQHAADRTPYICQSQSLNIFLPSDVHKKVLHEVHMMGWKLGVKSFYYCRSKSLQRAESSHSGDELVTHLAKIGKPAENKYEECLACQ